jgi:S1-C subfamily serine protease
MLSRLSRARNSARSQGPTWNDESPGLSGILSDMSTNSPGAMRMNGKSRKAARNSPYGSRRGNRLTHGLSSLRDSAFGCDDGKALLTPGRKNSSAFVPDKHVNFHKSDGPHGLQFSTDSNAGVVVCGIDRTSQGATKGVLVGDILYAIDSVPVKSHLQASGMLLNALEAGSVTLTLSGNTRALTLDKTKGDLGMTMCGAEHVTRGVLLKRIQKGSLADQGELYCGDTIISVNETLVQRHDHAVALCNASRAEVRLVMLGKSVEATLSSKGPMGITLCNHEDPADGPGVKVMSVNPESQCVQAGISAGDLILSIGGVLCTSHEQAIELLDRKDVAEIKVVYQDKYSR